MALLHESRVQIAPCELAVVRLHRVEARCGGSSFNFMIIFDDDLSINIMPEFAKHRLELLLNNSRYGFRRGGGSGNSGTALEQSHDRLISKTMKSKEGWWAVHRGIYS